MCGLLFSTVNNLSEESIRNSLNLMAHRGPNYQGLEMSAKYSMGHNRLSIIDLDERSNQPFKYLSSKIVFNGEIYNYLELKAELVNEGLKFTTNSDTEVLCAALWYWGSDALKKFNGMWSFVFVDEASDTVIVARDRYGKKPLYYHKDINGVIFASEMKAIFSLKKIPRRVDASMLSTYLFMNHWDNSNQNTFYQNIDQVQPGETIQFKLGNESNWSRVTLTDLYDEESVNLFEKSTLVENIKNAVKIRLRADVKTAIFLSGGVDSSIIAGYAKDYSTVLQWLTGNTQAGNDLEYSKQVAEKLNVKLNIVDIAYDANTTERIRLMTRNYELPIIHLGNSVAMNKMYQSAAELGIKVVLDGTGGDEIFGGYYDFYQRYYFNTVLKIKDVRERWRYVAGMLFSENVQLKRSLINFVLSSIKSSLDIEYSRAIKKAEKYKFVHPLNPKGGDNNIGLIDFMKYDAIKGRLQTWLKMNDSNSMMYSVEARSPLLDVRLSKYVNLPVNMMYCNGFNKFRLRECLPSSLPNSIFERRGKQGFRFRTDYVYAQNKSHIDSCISKSEIIQDLIGKTNLESILSSRENALAMRLYSIALLEKEYPFDVV
tara:strand:+ start:1528 stop:3324 length:1797 start_codon:yes stop_codon:yes gene_type:complete